MKNKQANCYHKNICATETYGVQGSYDEDSKKYLVKQGDGGLNDDIECEDCGLKLPNAEIEFV